MSQTASRAALAATQQQVPPFITKKGGPERGWQGRSDGAASQPCGELHCGGVAQRDASTIKTLSRSAWGADNNAAQS